MRLFQFVLSVTAAVCGGWLLVAGGAAEPEKPGKLWVYIGTYADGKGSGIHLLEMNLADGRLTSKGVAAEAVNPSFLAIHPSRKNLYAVSEVGGAGGRTGAIAAYAIDQETGKLKELNRKESGGAGPCHLVVDKEGKYVLTANYGGGSVASLPIDADGSLMDAVSVIRHEGSSVHPTRQKGPHAHSINLDPENRFAIAADLGLDKLLVYRLDRATGKLTANEPASVSVAAGSGPRHFTFRPDGKFGYAINELANTITVLEYDAAKGAFKEVQTISTLPADYRGVNHTAEVVAHPSGKFLYGSNRGHDSIAIFAIDQETGKLTAAGHEPTGGKTPRNFAVDPTGTYLLACNQNSHTIRVFRIDPRTGGLRKTEYEAEVASPVCIRFMPAGK